MANDSLSFPNHIAKKKERILTTQAERDCRTHFMCEPVQKPMRGRETSFPPSRASKPYLLLIRSSLERENEEVSFGRDRDRWEDATNHRPSLERAIFG